MRASKDPRVYVPVAEDAAAMLGVAVAFLGVFLSRALEAPVFDAASSIVIGLILAGVAVFLAYETRALMVGETIAADLEASVRRICEEEEAVSEVMRVLGVHLSPDEILLTLGLRFRPDLDADDVAAAVSRIEERALEADPRVTRVFVEPEEASDVPGLSPPF